MTIGTRILGGLGLTLAIVVVMGVCSYRSTAKLDEAGRFVIETNRWVAHTYAVLAQLEEVLSLMKDAETGQRGFLITNEPAYLQPFNEAHDKVFQTIETLKDLTKDNSKQQRRLKDLEPRSGTNSRNSRKPSPCASNQTKVSRRPWRWSRQIRARR
jgi:CHASE3 domain sensor protein